MANDRFLVTGAMGCIGAWVLHHLVEAGESVISFDLSDNRSRVKLLLSTEDQAQVTFVQGDLTQFEQVQQVITQHRISHIIHLAALQVPFCKANPVQGAQVNVTGTVNIFEAARQAGLRHVAYASSIAVYGPPDTYPPGLITHDARHDPRTLYGVYKVANEGAARIYWQDYGLSSTALRPYTVYGVGRDQGLTSEPTKALLAVATGQPYHISFEGRMQFQWASDVARQFILAAREVADGAYAFNLGTSPLTVAEFVTTLQQVYPTAQVTVGNTRLPFPEGFDDSALRTSASQVYATPLVEGISRTIEQFETALESGLSPTT
jgi:nucleoside-diphosphate-sugar epimerase